MSGFTTLKVISESHTLRGANKYQRDMQMLVIMLEVGNLLWKLGATTEGPQITNTVTVSNAVEQFARTQLELRATDIALS